MSRLDLPPGALVGRDRELGFLRGFFQEAAVSGGAVLLSGEPGEVARYIGRHGTSRVAKAVLLASVPPLMLPAMLAFGR